MNWAVVGGTAAAAPLRAGLALLSQGVGHDLGHLNPRLYSEIAPAQILRRITEGNNGTATLAGFLRDPAGTLSPVGPRPMGRNC